MNQALTPQQIIALLSMHIGATPIATISTPAGEQSFPAALYGAGEINALERLDLVYRAWSGYHWAHSKLTEKGQALVERMLRTPLPVYTPGGRIVFEDGK